MYSIPRTSLPKCKQCDNELSIQLNETNKILLYCDKCYHFNQFEISNNLLTKTFKAKLFLSEETIICHKCNNTFCLKCYLNHEDYIDTIKIKEIKLREKNGHYQRKKIQIKTYSPFQISCNECNRTYNKGKINFYKKEEQHQNIEEIINNFNKAKNHFDCYYTKKKNQLIEILENKIKQIENYYKKSLLYHQTLFNLVEQLIGIYQKTLSSKALLNLNSICHFDYNFIEDSKSKLDTKINNFLSFLSNQQIFTNNKEDFFDKMKIKEHIFPGHEKRAFESKDKNKIIFYNDCLINIHYVYDDCLSMTMLIPISDSLLDIYELNSNQLLCKMFGVGTNLYIYTYTHNTYKRTQLPKFFERGVHLTLLTKDKHILLVSCGGEVKIVEPTPPYKAILSKKIKEGHIDSVAQLKNENLVFIIHDFDKKQFEIVLYDYKQKKRVSTIIEQSDKSHLHMKFYQELTNGNIMVILENQFICFNPKSSSKESVLDIGEDSYSIKQSFFQNLSMFYLMKKHIIKIYDWINQQYVFSIKFPNDAYNSMSFIKGFGLCMTKDLISLKKRRKDNKILYIEKH